MVSILNLVPKPLHRATYRLAHYARRLWYSCTRQTVHGCSIIACDNEGRFLLVRHSYGAATWIFPSGGIRKRETPLMATVREFREELQCGLTDVRQVGKVEENFFGAVNMVHIFTGTINGKPHADGREIVAAALFARDDLPTDLSRTVSRRLAAFDAAQSGGREL